MATPNSRATLISYCKRKLGDGMVDVNVTADQADDIIDYALHIIRIIIMMR